jgi:hypothetical protein
LIPSVIRTPISASPGIVGETAASSKKLKTATSPAEAVNKRVAAFVSAAVNNANEESMETKGE